MRLATNTRHGPGQIESTSPPARNVASVSLYGMTPFNLRPGRVVVHFTSHEPSQALKSLITTTACVSVCARCLLPTMAHDCTWPQIDVRLDTDVRLGKSPTLVFARVWVDASGNAVSVEAFRRPSRLWSRGEVLGSPSALPNAPEFAAGIFASHRQRCRPRHAFAATA